MKSRFLQYGLGLLAGVLIASCSSENESNIIPVQQEIKLTNNICNHTRGVDLTEQSTLIKSTQKIGVTIAGASSEHNNKPWITDDTGKMFNTGKPVYYTADNDASIYAYQPYNADWTDIVNGSYSFNVDTDQSTDGYANSDLLWATATSVMTDSEVILTFKHLLSKINVIVESTDGTDVSKADIFICGTNTQASFSKGKATVTANTKKDILAGKDSNQATAIIVPQDLAQGLKLIKVDINGKMHFFSLPTAQSFKSGYVYTFKVRVFENSLSLENAIVEDWNEGDITTGDCKAEEFEYMFFEAQEDNCTVGYQNVENTPNIQFSYNGLNWAVWEENQTISLSQGEVLYVKGNNESGFSFMRNDQDDHYTRFRTSGAIAVHGNIMSLLYGDDFENKKTIPNESCFVSLFESSSITSAPILPAMELANYCYKRMFEGCKNLKNTPALPATDLKESCYWLMFSHSGITEAPSLSSTTLVRGCYREMFSDCTDLISAPELPATALAWDCYFYMFKDCAHLSTAPELPATELVNDCYNSMFEGCSMISSIKASFTTVPNYTCLNNWLYGTAATGTIYQKNDATWNAEEAQIPEGWTIVKEHE